jgi:hypothetical protein
MRVEALFTELRTTELAAESDFIIPINALDHSSIQELHTSQEIAVSFPLPNVMPVKVLECLAYL